MGLKSVGRTPTMKMTELIISKVSNIVQVAIGHDGVHALLINDDGTVYFAGKIIFFSVSVSVSFKYILLKVLLDAEKMVIAQKIVANRKLLNRRN